MNRPRRPTQMPPRRRPSGPPPAAPPGGPPRRRSPLDQLPASIQPPFKVLGTGVDRQALLARAQPLELAVVQLCTREIEEAFQKSNLRPEEFWNRNPKLLETARKLDDVLAGIQARSQEKK